MPDPAGCGSDGPLVSRRTVLAGVGAGIGATAGCLVRGDESDLRGEIQIDGSNTVLPHSAAIAEEFQWKHNRVQLSVRGSGTGAGFQRLCAGETDVQNASREILDDEAAWCRTNGVEYLALEAALDGLAIIAHPENTWCDCLTVDELAAVWRSGSTVETWSDVRDEWPDEPIDLYGRDAASGTFDYFTEALTGEIGNIRSDYSGSADTNVIVRGVRGNRYALGFGGAGYYYENESDLSLIGVDDGDGCVRPTRETVESGSYTPLTRPLYVYFRPELLDDELYRAFTRFYFEPFDGDSANDDVVEPGETLTWTQWAARRVGFYGIPDETVEAGRTALEEAIDTHASDTQAGDTHASDTQAGDTHAGDADTGQGDR